MSNDFDDKPGMGVAGWCLLVSAVSLFVALGFQFYQMKALFFF